MFTSALNRKWLTHILDVKTSRCERMNPFDTNLIERKLVASPNFTMLCWDLHTAGSSYQQLDTKSSASWLKYIFLSAQGQAARKIHVQASASKLKKWPDLLFPDKTCLQKYKVHDTIDMPYRDWYQTLPFHQLHNTIKPSASLLKMFLDLFSAR